MAVKMAEYLAVNRKENSKYKQIKLSFLALGDCDCDGLLNNHLASGRLKNAINQKTNKQRQKKE